MAKKITAEEGAGVPEGTLAENAVNPATAQENTGNPNGETGSEETAMTGNDNPVETAPEGKAESTPPSQAQPETPLAGSYPPSVEAILKSFPTYESLYIDSHGGIYTPATAPAIRGNAILYKNPYYK
jgi:hypothetical protein